MKSGATGYDVVVPSQNFVTIMISEGMLEKFNIEGMANYKNVEKRWQNLPSDPTQEYPAPWQMGLTSFSVNMEAYDGPSNSEREFLEPNDSVSGKVQALLLKQKPHVKIYNSETMIDNLPSGEVTVSSH